MKNREQLVKELKHEIKRRKKHGNSDYQTLIRQAKKELKPIVLNQLQLLAVQVVTRILAIEAGRGAGKSSILADRIMRVILSMPRSVNGFVGPSYKHLLTRTLPSTIQSLEMYGLFEGLHYFVRGTAPKSWNWDKPYQPPKDTKHFIHFYTGAGYHLISQDVPGDGRGLNLDSAIAEEATMLDKDKYDNNVGASTRGSCKAVFEDTPYFLSEMFVGTTAVSEIGRWYATLEEKAKLNPQDINFLKAPSYINKENLGVGWFKKMMQMLLPYIYDAEIKNIRIKKTKNPFYPILQEAIHTYIADNHKHFDKLYEEGVISSADNCLGDLDLLPDTPLTLGVDWGAAINCAVVCQDNKLSNEFRALKDFHVLSPQILDHLMNNIADYYQPHPTKTIYLWYDNTGNNQQANDTRTYAQQAKDVLEKRGWTVFLMTKGGTNPFHAKKYLLFNMLMEEKLKTLPKLRFNRHNCKTLLISMNRAKTKAGKSIVEKDKSSEKSKKTERQYATDLSDAWDSVAFGLFENYLRYNSYFTDIIIR